MSFLDDLLIINNVLPEYVELKFSPMDLVISPNLISGMIKRVIFNEPATIVLWKDGTKSVVKCCEGDTYDKEKGLMACIIKKLTGNTGRWNEIIKEWCYYEDS